MIRATLIAAASIGIALSALAADWAAAERAAFIASCVMNCRTQPGTTEARCGVACTCTADESEKFMTRADWAEADVATGEGKSTTKLDQVLIASGVCSRRSAAP